MVASRSARERKAAVEAGPLARVKIELGPEQEFLYKVTCTECVVRKPAHWSSWRAGRDNGYLAAMDRWIFHLVEKHPDAEAPCLAYRAAAEERLQASRDGRTTG